MLCGNILRMREFGFHFFFEGGEEEVQEYKENKQYNDTFAKKIPKSYKPK